MQCVIEWHDDMRAQEWDTLCRQCPHTTLLQSYAYAQTMRAVHKQTARHGIIYIDGQKAGIVQMQEVGLFGRAIHGLSIDRGPLWFKGYGSFQHTNVFAKALDTHFSQRFGRKRRFLPEFNSKNTVYTLDGWQKDKKSREYKTIIVDLSSNLNEVRQNLNKKWRNILNKSEKQDFNIVIDPNLESLGGFLSQYTKDRLDKRYAGASMKFLSTLAQYTAIKNECLLLNAVDGGSVIASILIFQHGTGATYQAGWTTPQGRDVGAHHRLLWNAIVELKKRGATHFDLGGYNDDSEGIRRFKDGLGGRNIALIGRYS